MELLGEGFRWNELEVGQTFKTFGRTITETDIVNFISCAGMLECCPCVIRSISRSASRCWWPH